MMKEFWEERYNEEEYSYGLSPNLFFKEQLDQLKPGKLLLPFEGEGRNAVYAASQGWDVVAFDFSPAGKKKAMELAKQQNVTIDYIVSSWESFDFQPETYDVVALIYAHLPSPIRTEFHHKAAQSLKKEGRLILEAFNKNQLGKTSGGPNNLDALFSMEDLRNDFHEVQLAYLNEQQTVLTEGKYHVGLAEVIRLVAVK